MVCLGQRLSCRQLMQNIDINDFVLSSSGKSLAEYFGELRSLEISRFFLLLKNWYNISLCEKPFRSTNYKSWLAICGFWHASKVQSKKMYWIISKISVLRRFYFIMTNNFFTIDLINRFIFFFLVLLNIVSLRIIFVKNQISNYFLSLTRFSTFQSMTISDISFMTSKILFWRFSSFWSHFDKTLIIQSRT